MQSLIENALKNARSSYSRRSISEMLADELGKKLASGFTEEEAVRVRTQLLAFAIREFIYSDENKARELMVLLCD